MSNKNFIQRFFWNIAGAEIPILEKCRTDYKKFAAIGATIAMTSFIAFLSGTAAAWYFTQRGDETVGNIILAIAFGLVWATLIFCIDRSLVITLKKGPDRKSKFWWAIPFGSRALLALIIAFMVSIPLELVVFEDFIAEQELFWNESKSKSLSENSRANRESNEAQKQIDGGNSSLRFLDGQKNSLEAEKTQLESERQTERGKLDHPNTTAYRNANSAASVARGQIATLRRRLASASEYEKRNINKQIATQQAKAASNERIAQNEIAKWNPPVNKRIEELDSLIQDKQKEIEENKKSQQQTQQQIISQQQRQALFIHQRDSLVEEHKKILKQGNHFIQNFEILEYAVGVRDKNGSLPTEWFFLWLIRLLFFIIELLPTVVKIVMPIGMYDRMVHAEELDMAAYLSSEEYQERIRSIHEIEIKAHEEQLQMQSEAEKSVRAKILEEMKAAQLEIAEAAVRKWKEEEVSKLSSSGISTHSITPPPISPTSPPPFYSSDK